MILRFAVAALAACFSSVVICSQETNDVVLGSVHDIFSLMACGVDGRTYLSKWTHGTDGSMTRPSILSIARDGSIVTYKMPEEVSPELAAWDGSVLSILVGRYVDPKRHEHENEIYQMDDQANLLGHHPVTLDFIPMQMAVLPSGKTIVAGHLGPVSRSRRNEWTYVGAVFDADGHMIERFDFPSTPDGKWTFPGRQKMMAIDGAAYMVLETDSESAIGIAKISETGRVDIKIIPEPPDDDRRIHRSWLLAPGVAVEEYNYTGKRPFRMDYDEYDLKSGQKIATKVSSGGSAQCYSGTQVSWLVGSAQVDPSRHLSPDTLRLVFSKLENEAASSPHPNQ